MNASDLVRRLHHHRMWVTQLLLKAVRSLTVEQLHSQLMIGQGSVWKTLTHLLAAEYVWLEALLGNDDPLLPGDVKGKLPGNQEGSSPIASLSDLESKWRALDCKWSEYLSILDDKSLEGIVYKVSTSSGFSKRHGTKRSDVLLHVCTHAQYTTAQLINMLRQLGQAELSDVMLISLARVESAEHASADAEPALRETRSSPLTHGNADGRKCD
jgi:uncharacterized damage-inducible protein DinB